VNGRAPIADNVLGEMGQRTQIAGFTDDRTGERRGRLAGDRYLCYEGGNGSFETVWASEADAAGFWLLSKGADRAKGPGRSPRRGESSRKHPCCSSTEG
jgi:hypothetical protein